MIILMHEPTEELFAGVIHPDAALFSDFFDIEKAAKEHQNYRAELERAGAKVLTVREILLQGTVDDDGNTIDGKPLDDLRSFARQFLTYNTSAIPEETETQRLYKEKIISKSSPKTLVRIIFLQPEIVLTRTASNTGLTASYVEHPIMNTYFMRDQMIATSKGIIIGKMNSPQRQSECLIAEFCLNKIGMAPIYKISGDDAFLEGGDFLPAGPLAFIGCGLRTTQAAINQILDNDLLGCNRLVVVRDHWDHQEQMHLDTYFNVVDHDLVTLSENRYRAPSGDSQYLTADIYERRNGAYVKAVQGISFVDYLTDHLKMKVIPISRPDELNYACNFLAVGPRRIMAVAGQSAGLQEAFQKNSVNVTWIPLENLTKGFGAAHCMTQILDDGSKIFADR